MAPANVNGGWVGRVVGRGAVARVHFVHFATFRLAKWTLGSSSVHFVHVGKIGMTKWTNCTLRALGPLTLPTQRS